MSRQSVLARGRAAANRGMTETVQVGEFTDGVDDNLNPTLVLTDEHYDDIGQISYPSLAVAERQPASQQAAATAPMLKVPVGAGADIRPGDRVLVVASTADPTLVGRSYRVAAWPQSGQVTSHRYPLEEWS